jgi:hypothetical protein
MRAAPAGLLVLLLSAPAVAAPIVVPFEMVDNQLYVRVTVDGQGPFRFMLDTGAVDIVAQSLTTKLGLDTGAGVTVRGTGNGTAQSGIVTVPSVTVGADDHADRSRRLQARRRRHAHPDDLGPQYAGDRGHL